MTLSRIEFYSANVSRWHASPVPKMRNCGDNILDHHHRCIAIVWRLFDKPPQTLLNATRWHDQPEVILGDMPFTAKRDFPELTAAWDLAERDVIKRYDVPQPANQWECDVQKMVDRLDAYMMVQVYAPHILNEPDWEETLADLKLRADKLGVLRNVCAIL